MITDAVIKEIYKRYDKPVKRRESLNLPYYQEVLSANNPITVEDEMISIDNVEEFSPFKRFLIRSLNGIIEFDTMIAFVLKNHIIFMNKEKPEMRVHLRPHKPKGLFSRLFS